MSTHDAKITEVDFPAIYRAADHNSLAGQRRFLRATRIRLTLLVVAGLFGILKWRVGESDLAGIGAACAFGGAIFTELYLLRSRPDRLWYDGRAAAESTKTLTWRYLVGGAPFTISQHDEDAKEDRLMNRFERIAHELQGVELIPVAGPGDQITATMRAVRALPFLARQRLYRKYRIEDQRDWYARRARWNERRGLGWSIGLTLIETGGMIAAILKATGAFDVDLIGLAAALAGAATAWLHVKQHQTLASAYAVASHELADISSRIDRSRTEEEWSQFVDQAEEAISREHTMWRASHSG